MSRVLIVGATRGLGASLARGYAQNGKSVFATCRSSAPQAEKFPEGVEWITGVDLMKQDVGDTIVNRLRDKGQIASVYITAGYFATEEFDKGPKFEDEVRMYTTSAIAPVFIVHRLVHANLLGKGSKVILVTSESGSLTLRHEAEGGGNYGHHASKAAENMVGKLLSLDLKDKGIIVTMVHPGFMRTEMTKSVGFDKFYDEGGAVTPDEAAETLRKFVGTLDMSKSGTYWAPRGGRDIGTAEMVLGKDLPTPLQLPW